MLLFALCSSGKHFKMKVSVILLSFIASSLGGNVGRVVGGADAKDGQFPYQVSLRYDGKHNCGGSILDEKTILTAAHCVQGETTSKITAVVGSNSLKEGGQSHQVVRYDIHEEYDPFKIHNDIAIIKLKTPITFNDHVKPVHLRKTDIGPNSPCTLSGWGLTKYPGGTPNDLQYINLKTIDLETCNAVHKKIIEEQVCTFTQKGEGACQGDSGGPLVDDQMEQIGVVSWGTPCARGKPDVFTRVHAYLDWIGRYVKV